MDHWDLDRRNLLDTPVETWRPPVFTRNRTGFDRARAVLRRYFDLMAGSIWKDLSAVLPSVRGTVVDAGCGAQQYRMLLAPGTRYIGLDIREAGKRFGYGSGETVYYSGRKWPFRSRSADFILCSETLEHVPDPVLFIREMFRVLKPGGGFVLTVPFAARWHFIPHDYWRFTPSGLDRLMSRAGFREIRVLARGNPLTVAGYKACALILPLFFSRPLCSVPGVLERVLGLPLLPVLLVLTVITNLTLGMQWGQDCLGYTVTGKKPKR